jgi:hypothetical protein
MTLVRVIFLKSKNLTGPQINETLDSRSLTVPRQSNLMKSELEITMTLQSWLVQQYSQSQQSEVNIVCWLTLLSNARKFIAALFTIAKLQKQPRCPTTNGWIRKMCVYIMAFYLAIRKKGNHVV